MSIKRVRSVLRVNAWATNAKHVRTSMKRARPVARAHVRDKKIGGS
jgi:hypothetical protein